MSQPHVYSDDERRLTLISIIVVFWLSSMNQTVVATAMPRIVSELNGLHLYAWGTTSYQLASTVTVPIWGKLGDIFGRKPVLLVGIGVFLIGSWLSGLAGEFGALPVLGGGMTQLIVARALQGLGGGALFTTVFAIAADLYPPRERAKFSGVFGSLYGLASVAGPVIGGFFTDHGTVTVFGHVVDGWRWVFYLNVPVALAALATILFKMPDTPRRGEGQIDYLGAILIVAAFVPLLLALTWAGHDHAWASPTIVLMLTFAAGCLIAFVFVERAVWDPILPLGLFRERVFATGNAAAFIYHMAFMGLTAFLPLYIQVGQGVPATESGLIMLAILGGMVASSAIAGQIVTRTGDYKPVMIGGGVILIVGAALLTLIGPQTSPLDLALRLLVVGLGLGPGQSLFVLAVQNAAQPHQLGVSTSSNQFVRQIGGTIGVALFGAILTASLTTELARRAPAGAAVRQLELGDLQRLAIERDLAPRPKVAVQAAAEERMIRQSFTAAIRHSLGFVLIMLVLGFAVMLFIPRRPLRDHRGAAEPEGEQADAA